MMVARHRTAINFGQHQWTMRMQSLPFTSDPVPCYGAGSRIDALWIHVYPTPRYIAYMQPEGVIAIL